MRRFLLLLCLSVLVAAAWYLPNRPVDPPGGQVGEKFASLSFSAYRPWESPLSERFPTEAEADADMALVAGEASAVRSYAAIEGSLNTAALAKKHGLKLWQGIWLGGNRAKNEIEMARAIELAHQYPDTISRVVVGNEVLLRRDLPPDELIADIDRVKHAVRQPVAYADVWRFWKQFPQIAPHVDVMLIHLLPYWEDVPTGIDGAVAHVNDTYREMRRLFPGKQIAIGETGWPSRGRQRADAVPSRINEARFLRAFLALSRAEHFDYNFIEAFDQTWKYESEGIVGANWGIFDASRGVKISVDGPISEDPLWPWHAGISIAAGLALSWLGLAAQGRASFSFEKKKKETFAVSVADKRSLVLIFKKGLLPFCGMLLGAAWGLGVSVALETLYDVHLQIAAAVNIVGQAALAMLAMLRLSGRLPGAPLRTARDTTEAVRALLTRGRVPALHGAFEDCCVLFLWSAAILQMLLLFDPRYREFPLSSFAVPLVVAAGRLIGGDAAARQPDRLALLAAGSLCIGAVASAIQEGWLNGQSLTWNGCALLLASLPLWTAARSWRARSMRNSARLA